MMGICSSAKVRTLVWSFLLKVGILALGVGWVILIALPSPPNQSVSDQGLVLPNVSPDPSVQALVPSGDNPLPPQSSPISLIRNDRLPQTVQAEHLETNVGISPPLDLNEATQEELERLPGLGTVLAQRILAYRQANGPFHQVEELERIRGIGHKRLQQLRPLIRMTSRKV